jgi:putative beta barrel porin BBP7
MAARWTLAVMMMLLSAWAVSAQQPQAPPPPAGAFNTDTGAPPPEFCPPMPLAQSSLPIPFDPAPPGNAFEIHDPLEPQRFYFAGIGAMGLARAKPGNRLIAVRDPGDVDTGVQPPPGGATAVSFGDVHPPYAWGVRGHVGVGYGPHSVELSGFYLVDTTNSLVHDDRGRLDLPFAVFPPPFGFTGNNFLWLQADRVEVAIGYEIGNAELNYRCKACWGTEFILGVRYFDLRERFSIRTDDEGLSGPRDDLRIATYSTKTHSRVVGPQIGFETSVPLVPIFSLGMFAKGMVGANFFDASQELVRADGLRGPSGSRSDETISYLVEVGIFFDLHLSDRMKFRAGYQGLCLGNAPAAHNQVDFDPNLGGGRQSDSDTIFFHGPLIEFRFCF